MNVSRRNYLNFGYELARTVHRGVVIEDPLRRGSGIGHGCRSAEWKTPGSSPQTTTGQGRTRLSRGRKPRLTYGRQVFLMIRLLTVWQVSAIGRQRKVGIDF